MCPSRSQRVQGRGCGSAAVLACYSQQRMENTTNCGRSLDGQDLVIMFELTKWVDRHLTCTHLPQRSTFGWNWIITNPKTLRTAQARNIDR